MGYPWSYYKAHGNFIEYVGVYPMNLEWLGWVVMFLPVILSHVVPFKSDVRAYCENILRPSGKSKELDVSPCIPGSLI